jgi:hypothetical protein
MIWRAILVWLLAVCAAVADLPRHASVASPSSCGAFVFTAANLPTTVNFQCHTNGNLTSDGLRAFQYDAENQLTNVYVAGQWHRSR